jgi:hypothetical protein
MKRTILLLALLAGCYDYQSTVTLQHRGASAGQTYVADRTGSCDQQRDSADERVVGCSDRKHPSALTTVVAVVVGLPLLVIGGAISSAPVH